MDSDIFRIRGAQYDSPSNCVFKVVEVNPIESCTRRCSFCPRSNPIKYPNKKDKISIETCTNLATQLKEIGFNNRIGFVGFGEPLLHSHLEDCIGVIHEYIPEMKWIEINTNGDLLTTERIKALHKAGCNLITVSMYDRDISFEIEKRRNNIPIQIVYRHHYSLESNYNLNIVNRSDIAFENKMLNIKSPCYIPFYSLMIDWNGDILPCANDWSRTITFGNINKEKIIDIITNTTAFNFKKSLATGERTQLPCVKCNVCGTMRGEEEFNKFKSSYSL